MVDVMATAARRRGEARLAGEGDGEVEVEVETEEEVAGFVSSGALAAVDDDGAPAAPRRGLTMRTSDERFSVCVAMVWRSGDAAGGGCTAGCGDSGGCGRGGDGSVVADSSQMVSMPPPAAESCWCCAAAAAAAAASSSAASTSW